MALAFVVANTLIVIIDSQLSVLSAWEEMLSFGRQVNRVELFVWTLNWTDDCSIVLLPVSYLSVWTCGQDLILFVVEKGLLESCWFEQTEKSCVVLEVPNDAWTVTACWYSLWVVFVDLDWPDSASVLLKWGLHDLGLLWNLPNSNFTLSTTWNDSGTIWTCSNWCASVIMSIINDVEQFTGLRQEGSDFTIAPSWDDGLSVVHEEHTVALKPWNLNS